MNNSSSEEQYYPKKTEDCFSIKDRRYQHYLHSTMQLWPLQLELFLLSEKLQRWYHLLWNCQRRLAYVTGAKSGTST